MTPDSHLRLRFAIIANIAALPLYWATLSYALQIGIRSPSALDAAAVAGAVAISTLTIVAWWRSLRVGAALQVAMLLPFAAGVVLSFREGAPRLAWSDFADVRFSFAVFLVVVVLGSVMAASLVALFRR